MEREQALKVLCQLRDNATRRLEGKYTYTPRGLRADRRKSDTVQVAALKVAIKALEGASSEPPGYAPVSSRIAPGSHATRVEGDEYVCERCHKRWGLNDHEEPSCD